MQGVSGDFAPIHTAPHRPAETGTLSERSGESWGIHGDSVRGMFRAKEGSMTDRSITMTSREVQALLAGEKTQHRVVLKPKGAPMIFAGVPIDSAQVFPVQGTVHLTVGDFGYTVPLPYAIGDRVLVQTDQVDSLTLIVTDVRVQRVQEISEADAIAEGAEPILVPPDGGSCPYTEGFEHLWNTIHAKRPEHQWKANPWVCALTFDVVKANIDEVETGVTVRQIEGGVV